MKDRPLGVTHFVGVRIAAETQGAQLALAQGVGVVGQVLRAQAHSGGHAHDGQSDQPGDRKGQGLSPSKLRHLLRHMVHQAANFRRFDVAAGNQLRFRAGPFGRQLGGAKLLAGALGQFLQTSVKHLSAMLRRGQFQILQKG